MRANSLFGGYCAIINCSAISLAVWNPELKKLYDRNVAVSYQTLFSVNFREGLGTRLEVMVNCYVWGCVLFVSFSGFIFGYDVGLVSCTALDL